MNGQTGNIQVVKDATETQGAAEPALAGAVPIFDLNHRDVRPELINLLSEAQARRLRALVIERGPETYLVGMVDPDDLRAQDELSGLLKQPIDVVAVSEEQWAATLDRMYRRGEKLREFARAVEQDIERDAAIVDLDAIGATVDEAGAPVVRLLHTIFDQAAKMRASDIHIEPQEKRLMVRYRIDGVLHVQAEADPRIAAPLIVRLKLMAGLDIAERRLPQDGRMSVRSGAHKLDVRMSTLPTIYGESVVLRVLMQKGSLINLENTGMPPDVLSRVQRIIEAPHGIFLVTGPTGSGKTTTLYGALTRLNSPEVKILTCEDPVEYRVGGITQVQTNEKIGLSFAKVLRSFLRQDPDIIFIGEIRDHETAEIAARAAMTGHLVLSTIHTNDAVSTPARLLDMNVPGYVIGSTLLAVLSQRLLRRICRHCSKAYLAQPAEVTWVRQFAPERAEGSIFRRGTGCERCNDTGYLGRIGVYELLEMTPVLAAVLSSGDSVKFEELARKQLGTGTLTHRVVDLVLSGETTIEEGRKIVEVADYD